jgi:DtxR family Mn-dependent transcriptional regulator
MKTNKSDVVLTKNDRSGGSPDDNSGEENPLGLRHQAGQAAEDYLKAIYDIAGPHGRATTNQIAERLGVKPASVTGMLQKLASLELPLVIYNKHRGVGLTPAGEKIAIEIIRHHRLLELFLYDQLGYSWDEVHREADLLEHFISEKFEERIAAVLGDPKADPHGDPIPTPNLEFPEILHEVCTLHSLRPRQRAIIEQVNNSDSDFLRYLSKLGLVPGANIEILDYFSSDDVHHVKIITQSVSQENLDLFLTDRVATQVHVRLLA